MQRHELLDAIVITICAVICGTNYWTEVETFRKAKQLWLSTFLALPENTPAPATFRRLFRRSDPEPFEDAFRHWKGTLRERIESEVTAFDGR